MFVTEKTQHWANIEFQISDREKKTKENIISDQSGENLFRYYSGLPLSTLPIICRAFV